MELPKLPKTFIGWTNIKRLVKEFLKMYSNQESFFSKKRFHEGVAFYTAVSMDVVYVAKNLEKLTSSEALFHVIALFGIAGYHLNETQKEKLTEQKTTTQNDNSNAQTTA